MSRDDFLGAATAMLQDVQQSLYDQANAFLQQNIDRSITSVAELKDYFASSPKCGWAEVQWSKPTGAGLDEIVETRSEARRVGKECVRRCRSWGSPDH